MTDERPNIYNRNKDWHQGQDKEFVSSESLFQPQAEVDPVEDTANLQSSDDPYKTRYDELKRHHDSKLRDLKQEIEQLKASSTVAQNGYEPPKTQEEIQAFREQNPELFEVVESQIYNQTKDAQKKLDELDVKEKALLKREAQSYLRSAHKDLDTITSDPAFHNWAEDQPDSIQKWIYENPYDGVLAAKAITLYKTEKGIGTTEQNNNDQREDLGDASALLPTRTSGANTTPEKKIWKESEIARMSMRQYERYEDEILAAEEEGRIVRG